MPTSSPSALRRHAPTLAVLAIAAAIVVGGLVSRASRAEQLQQDAQSQALPSVAVVQPQPFGASTLELPARIEAWSRAPIHARVSGYLGRWNVDIGSPVRAGQVLAEIETPDLDQSLQQARAELVRAESEARLAESTAQRWQSLLASESVSRQEVENRQGDATARRAAVQALQANVERVQTLQRYRRLQAPFDGIVTARNTDQGALVNVGTAGSQPLFEVSDLRRLRVYVNVPQRQVAGLRLGAKAELRVPERPGQRFEATVQSMAQAIDARTGSMRVQLVLDNPDRALLPGGFASVRFAADAAAQAGLLALPPSALIVGRNGVQVATLDAENRARLLPVTIARDLGNLVELSGALRPDARVVNSPPDGIAEGDALRVAQAAPEAQP